MCVHSITLYFSLSSGSSLFFGSVLFLLVVALSVLLGTFYTILLARAHFLSIDFLWYIFACVVLQDWEFRCQTLSYLCPQFPRLRTDRHVCFVTSLSVASDSPLTTVRQHMSDTPPESWFTKVWLCGSRTLDLRLRKSSMRYHVELLLLVYVSPEEK